MRHFFRSSFVHLPLGISAQYQNPGSVQPSLPRRRGATHCPGTSNGPTEFRPTDRPEPEIHIGARLSRRQAHEDGVHEDGVHEDGVHEDGVHEDGVHEDGVRIEPSRIRQSAPRTMLKPPPRRGPRLVPASVFDAFSRHARLRFPWLAGLSGRLLLGTQPAADAHRPPNALRQAWLGEPPWTAGQGRGPERILVLRQVEEPAESELGPALPHRRDGSPHACAWRAAHHALDRPQRRVCSMRFPRPRRSRRLPFHARVPRVAGEAPTGSGERFVPAAETRTAFASC